MFASLEYEPNILSLRVEAVRRMDEMFAWERTIIGQTTDERVAVRRKVIRHLPPNCAPG